MLDQRKLSFGNNDFLVYTSTTEQVNLLAVCNR